MVIDLKIVAIVAISVLTGLALYLGYDSALYATSVALIGGIAGYQIGKGQTVKNQSEGAEETPGSSSES